MKKTAKTNAQRQAEYRKRRATAGHNGEYRINTWVRSGTTFALNRLAKRYGVTKREMLEKLIEEADDAIVSTIDDRTPAWNEYFNGTEE